MVVAIDVDFSNSVKLQIGGGLTLWFDLWNEGGEITGDFNQYIFNLNDVGDKAILDYQSLEGSFEECFDVSLQFLRDRGLVSIDSNGNEFINN